MRKEDVKINKVIRQLYKLQDDCPGAIIYVKSKDSCVSCKIGKANIYRSVDGRLIIDAN